MLSYALETLDDCDMVETIVLVIRESDREQTDRIIAGAATPIVVVPGGPTRRSSEYEGLRALADRIVSGDVDCVAIHDGARPFMSRTLLHEILTVARGVGGAVPGYVPDEPLYHIGDDLTVSPAGESLLRVQTPQAFSAMPLLDAYRRAGEEGFEGVDTAETVQRYSDLPIRVVTSDPRNVKVTFVEDLFIAEDLAYHWQNGTWDMRP